MSTNLLAASDSRKDYKSAIFLVLLWISLLLTFLFLITIMATTFMQGIGRLDTRLLTEYNNTSPESAGARAAILGSLFVVTLTALMAIPIGVASAIYLEEFADKSKWYNKFIEVNIQNLAAVPAIIYGMLTLGTLSIFGLKNKNVVMGGALALALLILPVIILTTREALRAVPQEIRHGSLALGATQVQTVSRQTLPSAVPGIATGSILAISRAMGEAAPLLLLGALVFITYDPNGLFAGFTTMPIQIFGWTSAPQEEFKMLAAAAIILLLVILLSLNAVAIIIRNRFTRSW